MEFSDRMGLVIPAMSDELTACRDNWDRLDSSYSGAIWVTPGTIPDSSILYDGAIVAESTTGKVWRARRNANGSFKQEWIKYPWLWSGGRDGTYLTASTWTRFAMTADQMITDQCVNSDSGDLSPDGSVIVPIDAVYVFCLRIKFPAVSGNISGVRGITIALNNDTSPIVPTEEAKHIRNPCQAVNPGMYHHVLSGIKYLAKGTRLIPGAYNSGAAYSGANTIQSHLFVAVNTPVTR